MKIAICAVILAGGLSGVALAQGTQREGMLADTDKNGKISATEYVKAREDAIMRADTNHDGKVSQAEWDRAAAGLRAYFEANDVPGASIIGHAGIFAVMDANHDLAVTPAEIQAYSRARFARVDFNKDGVIDRAEAAKVQEKGARELSSSR